MCTTTICIQSKMDNNIHPAFKAQNTAVITGGASGIGLATAKRFVNLGMNVIIGDSNLELLTQTHKDLSEIGHKTGAKVIAVPTDVSSLSAMQSLRDIAFDTFKKIDVLFLNAGTARPSKLTEENGFNDADLVMGVNAGGVINGIRSFVPRMIQQEKTPAAIICTGSKQGITNVPGSGFAYNASKAVVRTVTELLANEIREKDANNISVHLLIPGWTFTGLTGRNNPNMTKPEGAWTADQVTEKLFNDTAKGNFYILCPDNQVTTEVDHARILYNVYDIVDNRSALSRWDPKYSEEFENWMKGKH